MKPNQETLSIHYYFNDNSHSMDAFRHNAMEKNILDIIKEISNVLKIEIEIQTEAREEGGVIDNLITITSNPKEYIEIIISVMSGIYGVYKILEQKRKADGALLENRLKEENIKGEKLNNQITEQQLKKVIQDTTIKQKRSAFYKNAESYDKITQISYQCDSVEEIIVERKSFKDFIIENKTEKYEDDEARITIISPILIKSKSDWKGIYKSNNINFKVKDNDFITKVINRDDGYSFVNGTFITAKLTITRDFDDDGNNIKTTYEVINVDSIGIGEHITHVPHRPRKTSINTDQIPLFESLNGEPHENK